MELNYLSQGETLGLYTVIEESQNLSFPELCKLVQRNSGNKKLSQLSVETIKSLFLATFRIQARLNQNFKALAQLSKQQKEDFRKGCIDGILLGFHLDPEYFNFQSLTTKDSF